MNWAETAIILTLVKRTCTTGGDPQNLDVPESGIRELQLVVTKDAHWKTIRLLIGNAQSSAELYSIRIPATIERKC